MQSNAAPEINLNPSIIAEGEELLSQLPQVKPGIQTTEFWLIVALNLGGLALIALGKVDGSIGMGVLSVVDGYYLRTRTDHKEANSQSLIANSQGIPAARVAQPPAIATLGAEIVPVARYILDQMQQEQAAASPVPAPATHADHILQPATAAAAQPKPEMQP